MTDATTRSPVPPVFDPLTLLQTDLVEQRKQVLEVMAQNQNSGQHSPTVAVATTAVGTKSHGKRKNSAPTARRWSSTIPRSVSPSKRTRTNAPRDGAPNAGSDRDQGPRIMMQYQNGLVKINLNIYRCLLPCAIIGPHWLAKLKSKTTHPPQWTSFFRPNILPLAESRLSCHHITLTRIAQPGGIDAQPMSKHCNASIRSQLNAKCAWAY